MNVHFCNYTIMELFLSTLSYPGAESILNASYLALLGLHGVFFHMQKYVQTSMIAKGEGRAQCLQEDGALGRAQRDDLGDSRK